VHGVVHVDLDLRETVVVVRGSAVEEDEDLPQIAPVVVERNLSGRRTGVEPKIMEPTAQMNDIRPLIGEPLIDVRQDVRAVATVLARPPDVQVGGQLSRDPRPVVHPDGVTDEHELHFVAFVGSTSEGDLMEVLVIINVVVFAEDVVQERLVTFLVDQVDTRIPPR